MKKPITPTIHGALDYSTVAAVAAAPKALDLPMPAAALCYALAGGYAGLSALTDYPLSVKRAVPFKAHGIAEAAIGAALPFMPWILGFADNRAGRNLCFGLTAMTFAVAALTDWNKRSASGVRRKRRGRGRPRSVRRALQAA